MHKKIDADTLFNVFGKSLRFEDMLLRNPWLSFKIFEQHTECLIDHEYVRKITWMFPEKTNKDVSAMLFLNDMRWNSLLEDKRRAIKQDRYVRASSMDGAPVGLIVRCEYRHYQ